MHAGAARRRSSRRAASTRPSATPSRTSTSACGCAKPAHEVHYCPDSVRHAPGVGFARPALQGRPAQLRTSSRSAGTAGSSATTSHYYVEDGLLKPALPRHVPDRPRGGARARDAANQVGKSRRLIEAQQRHISDLLREVVRLTAHIAELDLATVCTAGDPPETENVRVSGEGPDPRQPLEMQILRAPAADCGSGQRSIRAQRTARATGSSCPIFRAWSMSRPEGRDRAGDQPRRRRGAGPRQPRPPGTSRSRQDGTYAGSYPQDSAAAVAHLEDLRAQGAQYLLVPSTAAWWLDHYEGFAQHLQDRYQRLAERDECALYALSPGPR